MRRRKVERRNIKIKNASLVRASISFPPNLYESLEEIAKRKKVSLAWVVRDATEKYIADKPAEIGKSSAEAR
jgi:metal-responsive CopG/Arc/MetJ family transcriptional regulator